MRYPHHKGRSFTKLADQFDIASVSTGDFSRGKQPDARSHLTLHFLVIAALKFFEHPPSVLRIDADSVVLEGQYDAVAGVLASDLDVACRRRLLDGIAQKVVEDDGQLVSVGANRFHFRRQDKLNIDFLLVGETANVAHALLE